MTDAAPVIAHGFARTPISALDSELSAWHPVDLAAVIANEALARAQLSADRIDEVVVGCAEPVGAQGADVARAIVMSAGWPTTIGGLVVERGETSGMAALHVAADIIRVGSGHRVLVVGLGMASTVPPGAAAVNRTYGAPWGDGVTARMVEAGGILPAPRAAETEAVRVGLDRTTLDRWAERSLDRRRTRDRPPTIVPVAARPGPAAPLVRAGDPVSDDHLRDWGSTPDLPPAFDIDGMTTAATVAPPADGVVAFVLEAATIEGLEVLGCGRSAGPPGDAIGGVEVAVERACTAAHRGLAEVTLVEVVESSAATVALVGRALGLGDDDLNRGGGALATGDSGAAEELRLAGDAVDRLDEHEVALTVSAGPTGAAATVWRRSGSHEGRPGDRP